MQITKYVHNGKDISHDVHYIADHKYCRYGSDEEPKERLKKAYNEVLEMVAEITGLYPQVDRLSWSRNEKREVTVKIEFTTFTKIGTHMKAEIKGGYNLVHVEDPVTRELERKWVPAKGLEENHMQTIFELEKALAEYVRDGAGQMEFDFENQREQEVDQKILQMQK